MLEHLRPQYAKEFRCIGSDCEDTCCHGLDVVIDKVGYDRLRSLPEVQAQVQRHFVILQDGRESQYARIQLTASYTCPFLSAQRLCTLHREHGEYYLADICATYPRLTQSIDGLREVSLLLSCPEAARLVLLNPNLLPDEAADSARYERFIQMAQKPVRQNGSPHQFLWDIREFALLLVRDRDYQLWQRLFILGMFCKRLNDVTAAGQIDQVPRLLAEYARMIRDGVLRGAMDGIPAQPARQLAIVLELVNRGLSMSDASHTRFRECVQNFLDGIHFEQSGAIESFVPSYQEGHARYYFPFMQEHPFIFENYLVNYIFRTRFPYGVDTEGKPRDPITEYMAMIVYFATIKGLLIGMAGHFGRAFGKEHVVKLVQTFAKAVEQCPKFEVSSYLGLANAEGMALLLKNEG